MYDYIILGGGISGFYCALEILKHNKDKKIVLCEKYMSLGGRISTFKKGDLQWEAGAGRISTNHTMLLSLLKKYNHTLIPINGEILYKTDCLEPDYFEKGVDAFIKPLASLEPDILGNSTIKELLIKIHGKEVATNYLDRFPYRAEAEILRADLGVKVLYGEMGPREKYVVSAEGLSDLIEKMKDEFLSLGGKILYNYECLDINADNDDICVEFLTGLRKIERTKKEKLYAKKVICAMECEALRKIPYFSGFSTLKHLRMEPLLRTYAIYDKPWFSQLPKIVTPSPIRYFIPINYEKGVAMVSYTDSRDTVGFHTILKKYGEVSLGKHIQNLLKKLFGTVPDYSFFKSHYWKYGATYWLPGNYDPVEESRKSLKPFEEQVYIVGESFSLKQAWIEGALMQSKKLFDTYS